MRATRFDRLLAGTILAAAVAVPTFVAAAPRVETVYPAPPSLNGRVIRHHEPAQEPPAPRAQALPPPREAETKSTIDLGALDRTFAASDAQITPKLKEMITSKQLD